MSVAPSPEAVTGDAAEPTPRSTGATRLALFLTYAAAFATPWNGMRTAGLRPGDLLMLLCLIVFGITAMGRQWPKLPRWVWQFGIIIAVVTALHELLPTDAHYLAQRLVVNGTGFRIPEFESNLQVGTKFIFGVIGLPLMFGFAYLHDRRALFRSAWAFALGTALSALIGFSDSRGYTKISQAVGGVPTGVGRATGLSIHPNFLATTCVLAMPITIWGIRAVRPRDRVFALAVFAALVLGVYSSGSRGGFAVMGGAIPLSFAVMPAYRRMLPTVALLMGGGAALAFVLKPSLGQQLLQAVRLSGNTGSAKGSDTIRAEVGHQGILDFKHSPLDGVGMQVAAEAHNVYLQALASGGLLLICGYVIYVLGGIVKSVRQTRVDQLAYPFFVAALSGALLSIVENALVDRLAYVPIALIAAMPVGRPADPKFAHTPEPDGVTLSAPGRRLEPALR